MQYFAGILFDNSYRPAAQSSGSSSSTTTGVAVGIDSVEPNGNNNATLKSNATSSTSPGERSVIIPAGATFSIPINYTVAGAQTVVGGLTKALGAQGITTTVRTIGGPQPKTAKTIRVENKDVNGESRVSSTQREENRFVGLGMKLLITARVRSTTGGCVFAGVCLSVNTGGYPVSGPRSFPSLWSHVLSGGGGYPSPGQGVPQSQAGVYPRTGLGYPQAGYAASGMPLAVSCKRTFLLHTTYVTVIDRSLKKSNCALWGKYGTKQGSNFEVYKVCQVFYDGLEINGSRQRFVLVFEH